MNDDDGEQEREQQEDFWQWVALVVLLGCWLAEAYVYAAPGEDWP